VTPVRLTSVARILGMAAPVARGVAALGVDVQLRALPRAGWGSGDYVIARVRPGSPLVFPVELPCGRACDLGHGELVLGALGVRAATLEAVGSWRAVGDDGGLHLLTGGGLLGRATSKSDLIPPLVELEYLGHVAAEGRLLRMRECAPRAPDQDFRLPTIVVVGSSMSAGKTTTARALVRALVGMGQRVVAAKVTGAARYRDALAMADAGAVAAYDFVDVGLPSTVCDRGLYARALRDLLGWLAAAEADVAVVEAGASPLEPYNGDTALGALAPFTCGVVLCASEPYAVVGIQQAFGVRPDLVAGRVAATDASLDLVERLTGQRPVDARARAAAPRLEAMLDRCLRRAAARGLVRDPAVPLAS